MKRLLLICICLVYFMSTAWSKGINIRLYDDYETKEIEAHYAQYLYLQSLPEYSGSKWEDGYKHDSRLRGTAALRDYVDNKGSLKSGVHSTLLETFTEETLVPVFRKIDGYKNYSYDKTRIGLTNFSNLQELTVNC